MESPLRVLAIVPAPRDAAWCPAAAAAWQTVASALEPAIATGHVDLVRLQPATANALDALLRQESFTIVHVVTCGTSRPAARYGTLTLEAADGRARVLNAQNFARLCAQVRGLEVVILQNAGGAPGDLDVLRDVVWEQAASVVCTPDAARDARASETFVRLFYTALASGDSIEAAFLRATGNPTGLPAADGGATRPGEATFRPRGQASVAAAGASAASGAKPLTTVSPPPAPVPHVAAPPAPQPTAVDDEIRRKRAAGAFDVFLCHNVGDKPAVAAVGRQLLASGILPWLDQWELRPGAPWQRILEQQIANIHAAAVFVGRDGIGPWQRQELDGFLREFNKRGCPVIPVMLPGAAGEPQLPLFLCGMTWVDFRVPDPDPLAQLIWGITGRRPDLR